MTVAINSYDPMVTAGTFGAKESLTQSTATIPQNISTVHPITEITGGTATSFNVNIFVLRGTGTGTATNPSLDGPAVEGMRKIIQFLGTGEAKIQIESWATTRTGIPEIATTTNTAPQSVWTSASATGALVLSTAGSFVDLVFKNQQWFVVGGVATYATATS